MSDLSVGVNADIGFSDGGFIADLLGKIHLGINDVASEMRKANRTEQRRLAEIPNYFTDSLSTQATGTDFLNFGSPQNGRQWNVRLLAATSVGMAANAAVATWYVGPNIQGVNSGLAAGVSLGTSFRWQFTSLPASKDFNGSIIVEPNECLMVGVTGIPASSNLYFSVGIEDRIQNDARFTVALG